MVSTAPRRASLTCRLNLRARALRLSTMGMLRPRILTSRVSPRARFRRLSIGTLPTAVGAPAANTVAQALEGALASALGSPAEGPRQHAFPALVGGYEIADFRRYFGAKTGSVEHAIMADAGLQMVRAEAGGKVGAQSLRSHGLTDPRNVVLLAFDRHQRH